MDTTRPTPNEPDTSLAAERSAAGDADARQYAVKSLSRGLAILKLFDLEHPRWTLGDIVRASGQHKATCYRLLRTLEQDGS